MNEIEAIRQRAEVERYEDHLCALLAIVGVHLVWPTGVSDRDRLVQLRAELVDILGDRTEAVSDNERLYKENDRLLALLVERDRQLEDARTVIDELAAQPDGMLAADCWVAVYHLRFTARAFLDRLEETT